MSSSYLALKIGHIKKHIYKVELKSLYFNLAYVFFLFGAKNWAYKKTHIQSGAEKSLFQFCMTVTKPLSPLYLEEMKNY